MTTLIPFSPSFPVQHDENLIADWLASKSEKTRRAYSGDVARFSSWQGSGTPNEAIRALLGSGTRGARHTVLSYRAHLEADGLSPATINRALAALRSVVDLARDAGLVDWALNVKGMKARAYRNTKGPCRLDVLSLVKTADSQGDAMKGARDGALIRLLYGLGLRRGEAVNLRIRDFDGASVHVQGKGKHDRAPMTVPAPVKDALVKWLALHPDPTSDAPLFVALDNASRGQALSDGGVERIVKRTCEAAGVAKIAPHALRHSAITHALEATNGNVTKVRSFSRHAKLDTLMVYDDNRNDGAGEVASLVAL